MEIDDGLRANACCTTPAIRRSQGEAAPGSGDRRSNAQLIAATKTRAHLVFVA